MHFLFTQPTGLIHEAGLSSFHAVFSDKLSAHLWCDSSPPLSESSFYAPTVITFVLPDMGSLHPTVLPALLQDTMRSSYWHSILPILLLRQFLYTPVWNPHPDKSSAVFRFHSGLYRYPRMQSILLSQEKARLCFFAKHFGLGISQVAQLLIYGRKRFTSARQCS